MGIILLTWNKKTCYPRKGKLVERQGHKARSRKGSKTGFWIFLSETLLGSSVAIRLSSIAFFLQKNISIRNKS